LAKTIAPFADRTCFVLTNSAAWNKIAAAELPFQVLTEREEKNSMAIASNEAVKF